MAENDKRYATDDFQFSKNTLNENDRFLTADSEDGFKTKRSTWNSVFDFIKNKFRFKTDYTEKGSIVDADGIPIANSADSGKTYHTLFSTIKSTLKTYFDNIYIDAVNVDGQTITGNGVDQPLVSNDAKKQTAFVGICQMCPILASDIDIDYVNRTLTIARVNGVAVGVNNPIRIFVDGSGTITKYEFTTPQQFTWTDTSGIWFFSFDVNGNKVSSQTPWSDFNTTVTIYRLTWNIALAGSEKSVSEFLETHLNTISAIDHEWKHFNEGTIYKTGFSLIHNALPAGTPNADGRNAVVSLTTGTAIDDNLTYTVTNGTGTALFEQNMGNTNAAALNATNSGLFKIRYKGAGGAAQLVAASRFPFLWDSGTNRPQYIDINGARQLVTNNYYFVYFVYAIQDPRSGNSVRLTPVYSQYATLQEAQAATWLTVQTQDDAAKDQEIRVLYKLIFQYKSAWDVGTKYTSLIEIADLRKIVIAQVPSSGGSIPASSVTFVPNADNSATNAQTAIENAANTVTDTSFSGSGKASSPLKLSGTYTPATNVNHDFKNFAGNTIFQVSSSGQTQHLEGEYIYLANSLTADTVGDWRFYNLTDSIRWEYCTGANAAKGGGTWELRILNSPTQYNFRIGANNLFTVTSTDVTAQKDFYAPKTFISDTINHSKGKYHYLSVSNGADTIGDWRKINDNGNLKFDYCTLGNATKGAGTWASYVTLTSDGKTKIVNNNLLATITDGFVLSNETASTNTNKQQNSPAIMLQSRGYGSGSNKSYEFYISNVPSSNSDSSTLRIYSSRNNSTKSLIFTLDEVGSVSVYGNSYFTNTLYISNASNVIGAVFKNSSLASDTAKTQYSPRIALVGYSWNQTTLASNSQNWIQEVQPKTGTSTDGDLVFSYDNNGGGYNEKFRVVGSNGRFDINSDTIRLRTSRTITNSTDSGNQGDVCWDSNYIYICTATNTWKRTAIATW